MNHARRKVISELRNRLGILQLAVENFPDADDIKNELESVRDEEQEAFDNLPDSIQNGEHGQVMSEAVDNLTTAVDKVDEIATAITTLQDDIAEVLEALDNTKGQ